MIGGGTMAAVINERHGFICDVDLPELVKAAPDMMVLIRCGCSRYTCRMDQVADQVAAIEKGTDYVRDVSLTADNFERISANIPYIVASGVVAH